MKLGWLTLALKTDLTAAAQRLAAAGIETALLDAQLLAAHLMQASLSEVRKQALFDSPTPDGFAELVELRAQRVPLQHLTGKTGFRHVELRVGPGVFIPRQETELVVQAALDEISRLHDPTSTQAHVTSAHSTQAVAQAQAVAQPQPVQLVDLCTGSGAIACAIANEARNVTVFAVELVAEAHAWAEQNCDRVAKADGTELHLIHHDATCVADPGQPLEHLQGCVDIVATNPPYIPSGQVPTEPEVRDHDPDTALYGESADGLAIPKLIAASAAKLLRDAGLLVMEHGHGQQQQLLDYLQGTGWQDAAGHQDYAGKERYVTARRAGNGTSSTSNGRLDT